MCLGMGFTRKRTIEKKNPHEKVKSKGTREGGEKEAEVGERRGEKRGRWGREGRQWRQDGVGDQLPNYSRVPLLLGFYQADALHRVLASPHLHHFYKLLLATDLEPSAM